VVGRSRRLETTGTDETGLPPRTVRLRTDTKGAASAHILCDDTTFMCYYNRCYCYCDRITMVVFGFFFIHFSYKTCTPPREMPKTHDRHTRTLRNYKRITITSLQVGFNGSIYVYIERDSYSEVGWWRVRRRTRASHPTPCFGKTGRFTAACEQRLIRTGKRQRWRSCRLTRRERQISRAPPRGWVLKMTVEASRHHNNNNNNTIKTPGQLLLLLDLRTSSLGCKILITAVVVVLSSSDVVFVKLNACPDHCPILTYNRDHCNIHIIPPTPKRHTIFLFIGQMTLGVMSLLGRHIIYPSRMNFSAMPCDDDDEWPW